jgi:putative ABC transport system substrate-binding protein
MLRGSASLRVLIAGVLFGAAVASARARVVVLRSADLAAYSQVVAGFGSELKADVEEATLDDDGTHQAAVLQKVVSEQPALVLAVGPLAATLARHALQDVPVLFCMVPYYERYGLEGPKTTGIALTSDLSVELSALQSVFPEVKRVGIVHDPRYSAAVVAQAQKVGQKAGVAVVPLPAEGAQEIERALSQARGKVNALLMIADKTVANAEVVRKEISFARAERLPVLGFADSQVKEGATLAFSPSYLAIGQQAGRLANRIINEKIDVGALAISPPEVLDLAVNLKSTQALAAPSEVIDGLLNFASTRGFPIRVFQ